MDKTIWWYFEKIGGPLSGIVAGVIAFFLIRPGVELSKPDEVVAKLSDVCFIIFGFLLGFLGLIFNIKDKMVKARGSDKLYNRTIDLNIKIIKISVITGVYGFIYWVIYHFKVKLDENLNNILISIFIFAIIWMVWDVIYFVRVFFKLVKNYS